MMEADLFNAQKLGVDAVTYGVLTSGGKLDEEAMEMLLGASEGMQVVFHMAFDAIAPENQLEAIDWLAEHGVVRILTHGGPLDQPITKTLDHLKETFAQAEGKIEILPGGGINYQNFQEIATELNASQLHGTKIVPLKN